MTKVQLIELIVVLLMIPASGYILYGMKNFPSTYKTWSERRKQISRLGATIWLRSQVAGLLIGVLFYLSEFGLKASLIWLIGTPLFLGIGVVYSVFMRSLRYPPPQP